MFISIILYFFILRQQTNTIYLLKNKSNVKA
jgi:hypothetical protein